MSKQGYLTVKSGHELLCPLQEKYSFDSELIINLLNRWDYLGFTVKQNKLAIKTEAGDIVFAFTGEVPEVSFKSYEKDQLILNTKPK